jgi:uncharacterized protein
LGVITEKPLLLGVRTLHAGQCPEQVRLTADGEPGLNYLCAGYRMFFKHIDRPMKFMVQELHAGRAPANVMNSNFKSTSS